MTEWRKRNGGIEDKTRNGAYGGIGDKARNGAYGGIEDKTQNGEIWDKTAELRIKRGIVLKQYNGCTLFKVYLFITVP